MTQARPPQFPISRRARHTALLLWLASFGTCAGAGAGAGPVDDGLAATSPQGAVKVASTSRAAAAAPAASATRSYYVRSDGGDARQCTGRADAAYPGHSTGQACAWNHPFQALPPGARPRLAAGDTLFIGPGSYMIGPGAPGAEDCTGSACVLPPVPSGASPTAPTRLLGRSCAAAPTLWGSGGIAMVINLDGSSNVEVGCLDITDHDGCVHKHSNPSAACIPSGAWAKTGLYARASRNVRLHDLNIHGMAATGINAGGLADWTVDRVKLIANGRAGWDGNVGADGSSNSGQMTLRAVEIAWNGCGQRWPGGTPWACWAQKTGGYGDGLGTRPTGGQWLIEDAFVHHNTSDGLDLRYMDGAPGTRVTVRRLHAVANAGNQIKVRGNATIENSVVVSSCGYFSGKHFMVDGDHCRAGGNAVQLVLTPGSVSNVRHNTIAGQGGVLIGATEGDASARVSIQNNVLVGFPNFLKPGVLAAAYYANNAPAAVSWSGNLIWNVKNAACPAGSLCQQDPKLADMHLATFDARPLPGSPAIGNASALPGVSVDYRGRPRPAGPKVDIGAMQPSTR